MIRKNVICIVWMLVLLSSAQTQTVMTREEAAIYALRAANALNTSIRWLSFSELPAGEEVADSESDKIDFHALQGLNYEDIVSISSYAPPFFCLRNWLRDVNYIYPGDDGYIFVNAFSGEVEARGNFSTGVKGPLSEEQATTIASKIISSFYGSVDHEWKVGVGSHDDRYITVFFQSINPSIGLNLGRRYAFVRFSPEGSVHQAYFYPLGDDVVRYAAITMEQAKQLVVNALKEAYVSGKETYYVFMGQKTKLPKARFVCLGKHPEAIDPDLNDEVIARMLYPFFDGEGIYFYDEDDFLQPKYVYAVLVTIEFKDTKVWTYYLVDIITGEVEGCGLTDIYFFVRGDDINANKVNKTYKGIIILNNQRIILRNTIFDNGRVYIAQDYLLPFKIQLQGSKLYGRNGEIRLAKDELRRFKGKTYVPLRRVCEVSGIRLWWDNERKIPILRAEWLEPKKLLAQKR